MDIVDTDPSEYIGTLDDEDREVMSMLDKLITDAMPTRRRVLWHGVFWGGSEQTIVGYGDIRQPRPRGDDVEWFLVGLAKQKSYYSLYVNAVADGKYLGQRYADRLGKVNLGSASIGIRDLDAVNLDVLTELLTEADSITPPDPAG
ncbi:MAG: DUF1801 domain-containing protein [Acidimicrobiia bacterium]|nr:DUF1801 domain-containing protein [Acidimicrobiia bacterium]